MMEDFKYMPTFRVRQQEILTLKSFDFGNHLFPLIEIIKEHDRVRKEDVQRSFAEIYIELINSINAKFVLVDLPLGLKESGSMNDKVLEFSRRVINNIDTRVDYLLHFQSRDEKVIPVISSYIMKTGETDTIRKQFERLQIFSRIAFRIYHSSFNVDIEEVQRYARPNDLLILDLDSISPYPTSPPLRPIVSRLKAFNKCPKIILRSAINTDIQNVSLDHGNVIFDADNSLLDTYKSFGADAFGDYVGVKKDDLTAGGTISPGFIYYDAVENQYYGYKATFKNLSEFLNTIVPAVLDSDATRRMREEGFLTDENWGYQTLLSIRSGAESGQSQAKFKRIAIEHYLFCLREKATRNQL